MQKNERVYIYFHTPNSTVIARVSRMSVILMHRTQHEKLKPMSRRWVEMLFKKKQKNSQVEA